MTSFTLHQEFLLVPETNIKNITVKEAHQTVYEDRISRDTNNHFVSEERCFSVYMDIFMTILKNNASSIPPLKSLFPRPFLRLLYNSGIISEYF